MAGSTEFIISASDAVSPAVFKARNSVLDFARVLADIPSVAGKSGAAMDEMRKKIEGLRVVTKISETLYTSLKRLIRTGDEVSNSIIGIRQQTRVFDSDIGSLGSSMTLLGSELGIMPDKMGALMAIGLKAGKLLGDGMHGFVTDAVMLGTALGVDATEVAKLDSAMSRWRSATRPQIQGVHTTMLAVAKATSLTGQEVLGLQSRFLELADLVGGKLKTEAVEGLTRVAGIANDISVNPEAITKSFSTLIDRFSVDSMRMQGFIQTFTGQRVEDLLAQAKYTDVFSLLQAAAINLREQYAGMGEQGLAVFNREIETLAKNYGISEDLLRRLSNTSREQFKISEARIRSMERERNIQQEFADTWQSVSRQFTKMWAAIRPVFVDIGLNVGRLLIPMLETLTGLAESLYQKWAKLSPETQKFISYAALGVLVIGPLVLAFAAMSAAIGPLMAIVKGLGVSMLGLGALGAPLAAFGSGLLTFLITPLTTFGGLISGIGTAFATVFTPMLTALSVFFSGGVTGVIVSLGTVFSSLLASITGVVGALFSGGGLVAGIGGLVGAIGPALAMVGRFMLFTPVGWILMLSTSSELRDVVGELFGVIGRVVKALWPIVESLFKLIGKVFKAIAPLLGLVLKVASALAGAVGNQIVLILDRIVAFIDFVMPAVTAIIDVIAAVAEGIASIFSTVVGSMVWAWNKLAGLINQGIDSMNIQVEWLGIDWRMKDIVGHMPIVEMAMGGIVDRPTRALVGEAGPEAIIPLHALPDLIIQPLTPFMAPLIESAESLSSMNDRVTASTAPSADDAGPMIVEKLVELIALVRTGQRRGSGGSLADLAARTGTI